MQAKRAEKKLNGTVASEASGKILEYTKRLLLWWIHHFISDLINNMDHMRILGIEPSSVILSQTKQFKK